MGEALRDLGKVERQQRGLRGGVIRVVFVMGWIVREGFQGARRGNISDVFEYLRPDVQVSFFCGLFLPVSSISPNFASRFFLSLSSWLEAFYGGSQNFSLQKGFLDMANSISKSFACFI